MTRFLILILLCGIEEKTRANDAHAAQDDGARYAEIRRYVKTNTHLNAHLVLAVDAKIVAAV